MRKTMEARIHGIKEYGEDLIEERLKSLSRLRRLPVRFEFYDE